ncbi:MAG: hypothetical protein ACI8RC_003096, partial [Ilumatobacter sp.]
GNDASEAEQLELGVGPAPGPATEGATEVATEGATEVATEGATEGEPQAWSPNFDTADDLGGLLSASSPLLSRAFRGAGRPRESPGNS